MDSQWLIVYIPLTFAFYIFIKHFVHKLRKLPPTPLLNLPLIGHLYLLKKPVHRTLAKISSRYGPVTFLQLGSRPVLVVSSPSVAEECFSKNDIVFANRPKILTGKYIGYNYTTMGWCSYGDHWRNLRKISSLEVLSAHRLKMLQGIRADEVMFMIRRLNRAAEERRLVDMKVVFFELTMNVLMRMIAGKRYFDENTEEMEEAKRFREITTETFRNVKLTLWDFLPAFIKRLRVGGAEKKMMKLHKKRDDFIQELVEECKTSMRNGGGGKTKTMIEVMLKLQEKEPEYYHDQLIRSFMLSLLVAGTDTTAGTLEWGLSLLLNNPNILKKAQLEIENQIGNERLLVESDIADLPYLRGIVNETLRMYPAGPLLLPHESSKPCTVGGYHVPAGTILMVNSWAIQNDPKYLDNPQEFKPERFEGLDGTEDGTFKLLTFGTGRRSCPGEGLAMRMLGVGLGSAIQCFDWEKSGKDPIDMCEVFVGSMTKAQPLMAYCKARTVITKLLS